MRAARGAFWLLRAIFGSLNGANGAPESGAEGRVLKLLETNFGLHVRKHMAADARPTLSLVSRVSKFYRSQ